MNTANLSASNTNKVICEVIGCDAEATSEVILRLESNERIYLFVCEKCKPRFTSCDKSTRLLEK
ncbi:MAG: hypothetical protein WBP64_07840 [Nitrososphaeraceae archaeon]